MLKPRNSTITTLHHINQGNMVFFFCLIIALLFLINLTKNLRIYNDVITLKNSGNYMIKLTISHAIAQSVKMTLFEGLIEETIEATKHIPQTMAETGKVQMSRSVFIMLVYFQNIFLKYIFCIPSLDRQLRRKLDRCFFFQPLNLNFMRFN